MTGIILDYLHLVSERTRPLLFLENKKTFWEVTYTPNPSETLILPKFSAFTSCSLERSNFCWSDLIGSDVTMGRNDCCRGIFTDSARAGSRGLYLSFVLTRLFFRGHHERNSLQSHTTQLKISHAIGTIFTIQRSYYRSEQLNQIYNSDSRLKILLVLQF